MMFGWQFHISNGTPSGANSHVVYGVVRGRKSNASPFQRAYKMNGLSQSVRKTLKRPLGFPALLDPAVND
jgi:hypothetical protein